MVVALPLGRWEFHAIIASCCWKVLIWCPRGKFILGADEQRMREQKTPDTQGLFCWVRAAPDYGMVAAQALFPSLLNLRRGLHRGVITIPFIADRQQHLRMFCRTCMAE